MKRMILQTLKLGMAMLDVSYSRGPRAPSDSLDSGRRVLKTRYLRSSRVRSGPIWGASSCSKRGTCEVLAHSGANHLEVNNC